MKVLNFIEICGLDHHDFDIYTDKIHHLFEPDMSMIKDFYEQNFKPELIIELFEGWEKTKWDHYRNGKMCIMIDEHNPGYAMHGKFSSSYNVCPYPITLDNFITDCQRLDIPLNWRLK